MSYKIVDYAGDVVNTFPTHWQAVAYIASAARDEGKSFIYEMEWEIIQEEDDEE